MNLPAAPVQPLTIAVADDLPEIQALAATWLTSAGHRVLCVENGRELIRLVRERPVDLVITDVMMPENDGFEVIKAVRESHPQVKIVTISGGANVMSKTDCLRVARALGAHAVLAKPFTRAQLFAVLDSVRAG